MEPKKATGAFKRLVKLLVRAFYDKNVPEKDPDAPPPRPEIQMRKAEQVGLGGLNPTSRAALFRLLLL